MKTQNLVNGYVLPNLFYELVFLEENGVHIGSLDWADDVVIAKLIGDFVLPRYVSFHQDTQTVVYNTLRYLLENEGATSKVWDSIWEASGCPIPTPKGISQFVKACFEAIDKEASKTAPWLSEPVASYLVNHDPNIANRLN